MEERFATYVILINGELIDELIYTDQHDAEVAYKALQAAFPANEYELAEGFG